MKRVASWSLDCFVFSTSVCWFVVRPYLSCTLLPCNFNSVDFTAMALSTDVATLAQLRVLDTEEQRQHRRYAVESGNARSEQSL